MRTRSILLSSLLLSLAGFCSCESIQTAPKGSPRIEVQVVYEVEEGFYSPFVDDVNKGAISRILQDSVQPLANIGLRFYAVPSSEYAKGQAHPDYVMTIRALDCTPERTVTKKTVKDESKGKDSEKDDDKKGDDAEKKDADKKEKQKEITTIKAKLYGVACKLSVTLRKHRVDAPALIVGSSKGLGSASVSSKDKSLRLQLNKKADEENDTEISESMLSRAFSAAAKKAFVQLQKPIDRELEPLAKPKKGSAK